VFNSRASAMRNREQARASVALELHRARLCQVAALLRGVQRSSGGRMSQRILMVSSTAAVLLAAVLVNLSVLDVISVRELGEALGRSLSVVVVSTAAILVVDAIIRMPQRGNSVN